MLSSTGVDEPANDMFADMPEFEELDEVVAGGHTNIFAEEMLPNLPAEESHGDSPFGGQASEDEVLMPVDIADAISKAEGLIQSDVQRQSDRNAYEAGAKLTPAQITSAFKPWAPGLERSDGFGGSMKTVALTMLVMPLAFTLVVTVGIVYVGTSAYRFFADPPSEMLNPFIFFGFVILTFVLLSSLTPIFSLAGAIWSLFFSKQVERPGTHTIRREDQPALYAFVDEICKHLDAPKPSRIDLDCEYNASASFQNGWLNFGREEYVLTIGVPLIASQSAEQLASVIAHEFGHFCQTGAMRTHHAIRHVIGWCMQSAYEKTIRAEIAMYEMSQEEGSALYSIIYGVGWVGRKMLWWFGYFGHSVSGGLSREMEYDADRYAVHIAGTKNFQRSMVAVEKHGVAHSITIDNLKMLFWEQQVFIDNIPRFMMHIAKTMPGSTVRKLANQIEKQKQESFDSHPPTRDRIEAAAKLDHAGMVKMQRPAKDLIVNWQNLCEVTTLDFYRGVTGLDVQRTNVTRLEDVLRDEHKLLLDKA